MYNYAQDVGERICKDATEAIANRSAYSGHCDEISRLILPSYKNTWYPGNYNTPGQKNTEEQIDSTAQLALSRFAAILDSLLTPRNSQWHTLEASDPNLQKLRSVRLWFEDTTRRLFRLRYAPTANFASQINVTWTQLGAFGNGPMFVDRYLGIDGTVGFRYKALPMGEIYLYENHQGAIDGFLRIFQMTARQAAQQFERYGQLPQQIIQMNVPGKCETKFTFYHRVQPRSDYDPRRIDAKGKIFASYYVSETGKTLVSEGGYRSFPMPCARYDQEPGTPYARGPAMMILPATKTLMAEKKIVLKTGHRISDPILLTHDDGLVPNMKPGSVNPGGVNKDGKLLIQPLPMGDPRIGKELMDDERAIINDAFLVNLFQVLLNDPKVLTATQVVEMANQKGILLAPTVGRQTSEQQGPQIARELELGLDMGLFDPMPPELAEAQGDYQVVYTSPMARIARSEENGGFMRSLETTLNVINITQDPAPLDLYNLDVALPEMSRNNGVPERWMNSEDAIAQKRNQRAQQQQAQQDIQAAPAAAAMLKAQAAIGARTLQGSKKR